MTEEGYLQNNDVVNLNKWYSYGFRCASNPNTQAELAKLVIFSNEKVFCDSVISGTEFVFEGEILFSLQKEIMDTVTLIASVSDVDDKYNQVTLNLALNKDETLPVTDFLWNRHGGQPATGIAPELGIEWRINAKNEVYAVITPTDGASLYKFATDNGSEIWNSVNTVAEKAALFSEGLQSVDDVREVSCSLPEKEYDLLIGTIYNNEPHLIHITKSTMYTFKGTDVKIYGQYK